jgi:transcriptional regulator with XRE-family HTH domain
MLRKDIKAIPQDIDNAWFSRWARGATVGDRLRWLLEVRQLKQTHLAEAMKKLAEHDSQNVPKQSRAATTQSAISNLVTQASRKPNAPTLLRLAAILQASPSWIMSGEGHPFEVSTVGKKDEKALLEAFRTLDPDAKSALLTAAKAMAKK